MHSFLCIHAQKTVHDGIQTLKLTSLKFCVDIFFYIFLFKLHLWNMESFIYNWAVVVFSLT
jgi:hypothetical protein